MIALCFDCSYYFLSKICVFNIAFVVLILLENNARNAESVSMEIRESVLQ